MTSNLATMELAVAQFVKQNKLTDKPLLLGFSGGPDSLCLAHILLSLNVPLALAHFDHGWRKESQEESALLEKWAEEKKIPFYSARSEEGDHSELFAREKRYAFFERLFAAGQYEALMLAHQKGDLAETILKRLLEGAHLINCKGMVPVGTRNEIPIWRPLLTVTKREIEDYLVHHELKPLYDKSNHDLTYLRARMRQEILPFLAESFQKEVANPLVSLGKQAVQLADYLDKQTVKVVPVAGPFGKMWDMEGLHPVEIEHILSKERSISRAHFERIVTAVQEGAANYQLPIGDKMCLIDRKRVFFLHQPLAPFRECIPLHPGVFGQGQWEWEIREDTGCVLQGWQAVFQGKFSLGVSLLDLAGKNCQLGPHPARFRKHQQERGIPAFLRDLCPCLYVEGQPYAEFLTQKEDATAGGSLEIWINHRR